MKSMLDPHTVLKAYMHGLFPMAQSADDPNFQWVCPQMRGQLSITDIHISKSLRKKIRQAPFDIRINTAFPAVIEACAQPHDGREETWINTQIIDVFCALHDMGYAHSVECWDDDRLVGGLYGLSIGAAFCGESMFSRATDASKIALIHLVARLWHCGFEILDTQFTNDHLEQFGVYEIAHETYISRLHHALSKDVNFADQDKEQKDIIRDYLDFRQKQVVRT